MGIRSSREAQRQRQRRYRERRRAGRRMIMIEVDEIEFAAAAERLNMLSPLDADDDEALRRALNRIIRDFCRPDDDA